jgi:hypothetical protein
LEAIPRKAVDILVDVCVVTDSTAYLYTGDEAQRIHEQAFYLQDLVHECVAEPRGTPPT